MGRTSEQLQTQSTFVNWKFDSIWAIDSSKNGGYPYLRGFNNPGLGGAPGSVTVIVTDNNNVPVTDATVVLKKDATEITLGHQGNGVYSGTVTTSGETYDIYVNEVNTGIMITQSGSTAAKVNVTVPSTPPQQHKHSYDQTNTDTKYLKTSATCTEKAVYYHSCSCGEKGTETTFTSGEPLGHSWSYSAEGATITATCGHDNNHRETATISVSGSSFAYTGSEIKPAEVEYSTGWLGGTLDISYSNNTNVGTASASITKDEKTASVTFEIIKAVSSVSSAPTAENLTYDGSELKLVTTGTASGGTMQYRLGESGSYSQNIPTATNAGEYQVYYYVKGNSNYEDCGSETSPLGSINVTINKRDITVTPDGGQYKIYGNDDPAFTYQITSGSLVYAADLQNGALSRALGDNKGTYAFTIGTLATCNSNYNVTLATGENVPTFEIQPRPVTLIWKNTNRVYEGKEQEIMAEVSNAVSNDNFVLSYEGNKRTNVGEYTAKVIALGNENYTLTGGTNITQTWSISYLETDASVTTNETTKNENGWFTSNVTLTPDSGYQISRDGVNWSDTLTVTEDGVNNITYYLKNASGQITGQKTITVKKDCVYPSGDINVGQNHFQEFLNSITFRYFFKNVVEVEISGTDATSGIAKIEYQKVADSASFNNNGTWTEANRFTMNANDKGIIYARITDYAGNYTIINSDGIVVYTDSTASDTVSYTRTTETDVTTDIAVNGNTVKEVKNGDTILNNSNYSVDGGKIVLKNEYLETLSAGDYTLTVSYNPYGVEYTVGAKGDAAVESTIYLTVNRAGAESAGTTISNGDKLSKTYDGSVPENVTSTSNNSSAPIVEYKKKGASDDTYSVNAPKDAGDYVVRVTYPQNEYYEASSAECEFTIGKKKVTVIAANKTKTYGDADDTLTYTSNGLVGSDELTGIQLSREDGENVGTYSIIASQTAGLNGNYAITFVNGAYTINPREVALNWSDTPLTYNGQAQKPTVDVTNKVGNDVVNVTVTGEQVNQGTYTATAANLDNMNYKLPETKPTQEFTIAPKNITVKITPNGGTYGGTITPATAVLVGYVNGHEPAVALTYTDTATEGSNYNSTATPSKAGTYTVTATVADTNYNLTGTATAQFVVAKASPNLTVNTIYRKTYGDAAFNLNATKAEGAGALSYSVKSGDAVSVNESGIVTIQKAGTAIITVFVEANANYNGASQDVTVEVERLIPSTPPEPEKEEFIKDTELSPKAPIDGISFNNEKEELLKAPAIFTESEKKEIEDGRGARVWIEVTEAEEEKITAEDKGKIETAVKESSGEASQLVYFNADLFKQVSGGEKTQIFEPGVMIQVTIKIPEELINKDESVRREYQIIRLHVDSNTGESTADVLESTFDAETKELTYQSDKFSVYVIAYKDIPVTPAEPEKPEKPTAPGTDDQQFQNSLGMNGKLKVSQTGNQINIEWGKVDGADGYNVYAAYCGEKFTKKYVRRINNGNITKITLKKINGKKLNLKKNYKLYVEAYKKEGEKERILGRTIAVHIVGRENSKCSNAKNIKLEKSSFALKIGKTATIKAKTILVDKSKKQLSDAHTKEFRYESSNKKVAKVDKNGKIKAVGKGSCYIYVYARNGYTKKVKVTVK